MPQFPLVTFRAPLLACVVLVGCGNGNGVGDKFIEGGPDTPTWVETPDHRVRIPLVKGLAWEKTAPSKDSLLTMRAKEGPTVVVIREIDAPKPIALTTCAEAHRTRIATAAIVGGTKMTDPTVREELRHGTKIPRLDYAVPLDPKSPDVPPASLLTSWTYVVDAGGCIGVQVTTLVQAQPKKPTEPDPEDIQRFDRVFGAIAEGTTVGTK